jgi:hypothetical protein
MKSAASYALVSTGTARSPTHRPTGRLPSDFSAPLARISFFAAAFRPLRVVAASSSGDAPLTAFVRYSRSMPGNVRAWPSDRKTPAIRPLVMRRRA